MAPRTQQTTEPESGEHLQNATFRVRNVKTGEVREVTQQQFMDEHLDSEGWKNVNPLNDPEAQRRIQPDRPGAASPSGAATGAQRGVLQDDDRLDDLSTEELRTRAYAADLDVRRGDGMPGEPEKADYVRSLRQQQQRQGARVAGE